MTGHGGSSVGSYLVDPTSPIPSHCAGISTLCCPLLSVCVLLAAVIEHVRDGCTVRAFLLPSMDYVTVMLSGIKVCESSLCMLLFC